MSLDMDSLKSSRRDRSFAHDVDPCSEGFLQLAIESAHLEQSHALRSLDAEIIVTVGAVVTMSPRAEEVHLSIPYSAAMAPTTWQSSSNVYFSTSSMVTGWCLRYIDKDRDRFRVPTSHTADVLADCGKESRSMFAPLRNDSEFYSQQIFCALKRPVEEQIGMRFQSRSGRRAYGQRLIDSGNNLKDVSVVM